MKEVQDHYFKKAKAEGYQARSAFKLEEIDKKQGIIRPGMSVLDLGCFPGSWMQYAHKKVGPKGFIFGVDLQELQLPLEANMGFVCEDVFSLKPEHFAPFVPPFDLVLSDMAPKSTGHKQTDGARVLGVCQMALYLAQQWLKPGGNCLIKAFHGPAFEPLMKQMKTEYKTLKPFKPKSSRKESREVFLLGLGRRGHSKEDE